MSDAPRNPLMPEERARLLHYRFVVKTRAVLKLVLVTLAIVQIVTFIFALFVHQISPREGDTVLELFSYATSLVVGRWLLIDAQRAWQHAQAAGHLVRGPEDQPEPWQIAKQCPRRWLVQLHAELHPATPAPGK